MLINLVVSYVKRAYRQHDAEVGHAAGPTGDLGVLLLGFVEYYANRFDYNKHAVASAHPTGVKAKRTLTFTAGVPVSEWLTGNETRERRFEPQELKATRGAVREGRRTLAAQQRTL